MPKYDLICFDVDGTLIKNLKFSWQLFHDAFGADKDKRQQAMDAFKRGDITYLEWAHHDISMWKELGKKKQDFFDALDASDATLLIGAVEALQELKNQGKKLAVISGSMDVLLEFFIPNYKDIFDDVFISRIVFDEQGVITDITPTEYDIEHKATALKIIADRENIPLERCAFIGDYKNDLHALRDAGLGIAFNSKHDEVKEAADIAIDAEDLRDLLPHLLE